MSLFDSAIARVASFGPNVQVSDDDKLSLYGLFKQARNGDANDKDAPSRFNFVQSAKFQAWRNLRGTSKEEAERRYVELVARLDPAFEISIKSAPPASETSAFHLDHHKSSNGTSSASGRSVKVVTPSEERAILLSNDHGKENGDHSEKPKRRQSLDSNFVFHLKPNAASPSVKLSNALERALMIGNGESVDQSPKRFHSDTFAMRQQKEPEKQGPRPRARSLDFDSSFIVAPWTPIEAVGEKVKHMVLKDEEPRAHRRGRVFDHLEGVGNVRDFGGLPALTADGKPGRIRSNVLLRCAQFNEATQQDAQFFLREFGLRTIVDFRSADCVLAGHLSPHFHSVEIAEAEHLHLVHTARGTAERLRVSLPLITAPLLRAITKEHAPLWRKFQMLFVLILERVIGFLRRFFAALPILENISTRILIHVERFLAMRMAALGRRVFVDAGLRALYTHMLLDGYKQLRPALQLVTEKTMHPAAFHCSFGKDRTGIVAALVLHAAGVPRDRILEDFEMSHHFVDTARGQREWESSIKEVPELAHFKDEWARSPAASLDYALNQVEKRFGSVDAYMDKVLGLDANWRRTVREVLVESVTDSQSISAVEETSPQKAGKEEKEEKR